MQSENATSVNDPSEQHEQPLHVSASMEEEEEDTDSLHCEDQCASTSYDTTAVRSSDKLIAPACLRSAGCLDLGLNDSESSEQETTSDCDEINEDAAEFASMAYMNVNTNGKITCTGLTKLMEANPTVMEDTAIFKKIKMISMGDLPMKPTGLSLSGSGMQLYVKLDSEENKKQVSQASVRYVPKIKRSRSAKGNKRQFKVHVARAPKSVELQRSAVEQQTFETATNIERLTAPRTRDRLSPVKKKQKAGQDFRIPQSNCLTCLYKTSSTTKTRGLQTLTKGKKHETRRPYKRPLSRNSDDIIICSQNVPKAAGLLACERSTDREVQPLTAGPSWKFTDGEIDVSNDTDRHKPPSHYGKHLKVGRPVFTSSDLPLNRVDHSPLSKKHTTHLNHHDRQHRMCTRDSVDSRGCSSPNRRDSSSDDDMNDNRELAHRCDSNRNYACNITHEQQRDLCDPQVTAKALESPCLSRMFDKATSSTSIFDNSHLSPEALDKITLDRFTEYTTGMRKDLKQNFRDLNRLIKEFSQAVLEKNNNRSSQSHSTVDQAIGDNDPKYLKGACSVM